MSRVICPNCGTEMKVDDTSRFTMGMTVSKETKGDFVLEADVVRNNNLNKEKENKTMMNKRDLRMETLNKAGIDTSKFFDVKLPSGDTIKMTMNDQGIPVVVSDDILKQIYDDGFIDNGHLFRRWITAQTFSALNYKSWRTRDTGYDAYVRECYPYEYQFKMTIEEFRVLNKLEKKDPEAFEERRHFFTGRVGIALAEDYLAKLKEYIDKLPVRHCKRVPYKRIKGVDIFVEDLEKKVYMPVKLKIHRMKYADNYYEYWKDLKKFYEEMPVKLPGDTAKCKMWIDAFKGAAGYYSLQNLIRFSGCNIYYTVNKWGSPVNNNVYYGETTTTVYHAGVEADNFIKSKLDEYAGDGYKFMAMLKKCIKDNDFDFYKKMKEIYSE